MTRSRRQSRGVRACSAKKLTPSLTPSSSNVSPSTGLKGFHVRSAAPNGDTRKAATRAILHHAADRSDGVGGDWWTQPCGGHCILSAHRAPAAHTAGTAWVHAPLIRVFCCVRCVQQVCVLHDFRHLLQHAEGLTDEEGHTHQPRDIHPQDAAELGRICQQTANLWSVKRHMQRADACKGVGQRVAETKGNQRQLDGWWIAGGLALTPNQPPRPCLVGPGARPRPRCAHSAPRPGSRLASWMRPDQGRQAPSP
jgi:hypothetical protein